MPMSWCNCCKPEREDIRELDYQHKALKEVPVNVFIHERTLEELNLEANRITELPRALFHCHELRVLNLADNDIHLIPPAIASLINLENLNLSKNSLSEIPDNMKCCKQLINVNLSVNPLERLPDGFTQLINLEEVYLNDTFLEYLPANFGRLSKLKILDLRENNLNTLPRSIARLCNLRVLDIGRNEFSDLPEAIGNLPELSELWADCNRVRCIPPFVGNLAQLTQLDLSHNSINWIAGDIENCTHLQFLALTRNKLQNIPDEMGNLRELVLLKLDENKITSLPTSFGRLANLNELVVSQNSLETLPSNIGLLRRLKVLNADDNRLAALPPELGSCTSLRILSVRGNRLENFPAELGHLANIRVINVADNLLLNLPVSILNLHHLLALWLSTNQATPLTTLQQEVDSITGQMICTNFMFPQVDQERNVSLHIGDEGEGEVESGDTQRANHRHIRFADNTELLHTSRLTRAPTPYPKELRSMAKHARILSTQPRTTDNTQENVPLLSEMQAGTSSPVTTTVVEPIAGCSTNLSGNTAHHDSQTPHMDTGLGVDRILNSSLDNMTTINENEGQSDNSASDSEPDDLYDRNGYSPEIVSEREHRSESSDETDSMGEGKAMHTEASVTNGITPQATVKYDDKDITAPNIPEPKPQPPPYHIAAAYSKQAAYFVDTSPYSGERAYRVELPGEFQEEPDSVVNSHHPLHSDNDEHEEHRIPTLDSLGYGMPSDPTVPSCHQATAIPVPKYRLERHNFQSAPPRFDPEHKAKSPTNKHSENSNLLTSDAAQLTSLVPDPGNKVSPMPVTTSRMLQPGFYSGRHLGTPVSVSLSGSGHSSLETSVDNKTETNQCTSSGASKIPTRSGTSPRASSPDSESVRSPLPSPENLSSSAWVFGQHKNPTVFPVVIKKNPGLGFTIAGGVHILGLPEIQQNGIYITKVNPSGPAATLLLPGDKILEVDGIDFSKLDHDQAVEILKQTKRVVNMMISRQK